MYVEFLTQEIRDEMRELTESFEAYMARPIEYDQYESANRHYLREVLALIRNNIKAYVNGEPVGTFHQIVSIDSDFVRKAKERADYFIRVKLATPVEYLGEIAAALAYELDEKQEETK